MSSPELTEHQDTRKDYKEDRYQTVGITLFGVLMVVYTFRDSGGVIRLISARKANSRERKSYERGYLKPFKEAFQ